MHEIDLHNKYGHKSDRKHAKKVYCRLCGCETESWYMTNVFLIAAVQKFLVKIISEWCGIVVERSDGLSVTVCTMQKMHSFC